MPANMTIRQQNQPASYEGVFWLYVYCIYVLYILYIILFSTYWKKTLKSYALAQKFGDAFAMFLSLSLWNVHRHAWCEWVFIFLPFPSTLLIFAESVPQVAVVCCISSRMQEMKWFKRRMGHFITIFFLTNTFLTLLTN